MDRYTALDWTELNWSDDGKSMKLVPSSRQCAHQINKLPTCSFVRVGSRYTCCINCIQSEQHPCLEIVYTDTADNLTPRKHFILGHFNFIPQLNVAAMHYQNREADTRHGKVLVSSWSWHDKSLMWWKSKFCLVSGARLRARDGRRNTALTILPCCRSHRRWAVDEYYFVYGDKGNICLWQLCGHCSTCWSYCSKLVRCMLVTSPKCDWRGPCCITNNIAQTLIPCPHRILLRSPGTSKKC